MKQVTQNMRDGKTTILDVPIPTPRSGVALVKIANSLVSAGTERMLVEFGEKNLLGKARSRPDLVKQVLDKIKREGLVPTLEATFNRLDTPMALGYSSSGVIVEVGAGMEPFKPGDRVACSGGNFAVHAEYNLVPKNLLTLVPENVDLESAAFTTLGAIALHGFRLAQPQIGESVAVIGLGLLGLMAAQIATAAGCKVFGIDTQTTRVALANKLGIAGCLREAALEQGAAFSHHTGFDMVLICADTQSNDPIELAGQLARDRGKVVATGAIGLTIPRKVYYEKELSFINSRSYGPGRYDPTYEEKGVDYPSSYVRWTEGRNFLTILDLLSSGGLSVKPLVSHRFKITEAVKAYEVITGKAREPFLGVVLEYPFGDSLDLPANRRVEFNPSRQSNGSKTTVGVIGAGLYANATLLPAMQKVPGIATVAISSSNGLNASHSAKKFGFQYATSGEKDILADPNINSVVILTRHNNHAELTANALAAGKHVFVEKPLALTNTELADVIKASNQNADQVLMVGYNRRFSPHAIAIKQFFGNRAEPAYLHYRVNAGFIPANHWTQDPAIGGGRVIGEACHFMDMLVYLTGSLIHSVTATSLPNAGKYNNDNISMTFKFEDGSVGVVDYLANGDKSVQKEFLEVFCGGKIAILNDYQQTELIHNGSRQKKTFSGRQDKGHKGGLEAFAQSVSGGPLPISLAELVNVSLASFAVVRSAASAGAVEIVE